MDTHTPSLLLDARDTARLVGLSISTIERLVDAKRFPAPLMLTRRTRRWRRQDLESWIANGCAGPEPAGGPDDGPHRSV